MAIQLLQTTGNSNEGHCNVFAGWPAPTTAGTLLIAALGINDPAIKNVRTPDRGWMLIGDPVVSDDYVLFLYYCKNGDGNHEGLVEKEGRGENFVHHGVETFCWGKVAAASLVVAEFKGASLGGPEKYDGSPGAKTTR